MAAAAVCCAGEMCCSCLCGVCMRCCNTNKGQHCRMGFLMLYTAGCGLGLLFLFYGTTIMDPFRYFIDCKDNGACLGVQSNYRLSFAFLLFHIAMLICSLVTGAFSEMINGECHVEGCWVLKALCLAALFVVALMIPNEFFNVYREISRVASCLYLIAQVVIIIDFAYAWNAKWVSNYEESSNSSFWMFWLFFFSGAMWVIALTTTVLNYFWFSTTSGCALNITLITITLVVGVLFTVLSITGWVEGGSLLTSSAVNLYCVYLCWLALASEPDSNCNDWLDDKSTAIIVAFSLAVTVIVVIYVGFQKKDKTAAAAEQPVQAVADQVLAKEDENQTEEERDRGLVYFHGFMILLSLYMGMMLTNWGGAKVTGGSSEGK